MFYIHVNGTHNCHKVMTFYYLIRLSVSPFAIDSIANFQPREQKTITTDGKRDTRADGTERAKDRALNNVPIKELLIM